MRFFTDKDGKPVAFLALKNAKKHGYAEISEGEYLKLADQEAIEEIAGDLSTKLPVNMQTEVDLINRYGSIGQLLVAIAEKIGLTAEGKPAGDVLIVDNFQDGKSKAPYNLQVRNTTGEAVKFIAVVRDAPYSKIPSLIEGDYSLEITDGDAGYTYTFTGKLEAYASITITGSVVSPVGNGKTETSPELYLG